MAESELLSGIELGLIPTLKACLQKCEEDLHIQKNTSSCSASSRMPNTESKSTNNCSPQQTLPVSPSSTNIKSNMSSESSYTSGSAMVNESKKKTHVAHSHSLPNSTFDYEQFMTTLPTNEKIRQEYLLHEYDRRLNMQIAYQAANFELHDALLMNNRQFRALICEQRRFEQKWPLLRTKSREQNESPTFHDESTAATMADEREACFVELAKEGRVIIEVVQYGVHMDVTYTYT